MQSGTAHSPTDIVIQANRTSCFRIGTERIPRSFSDMQSEKACDHKDHDHYADDIENIHCFAPIETGTI
jgi:hypothetical protein